MARVFSRIAPITCMGIAIALVLFLIGLSYGTVHLSVSAITEIFRAALLERSSEVLESWQAVVLLELRVPRLVTGFGVGAALGLSGLVLQSLFRNHLAEPGVLGVSSGASLGAVAAIYIGLEHWGSLAIPASAFICALVTISAVYGLASRGSRPSATKLLLCGIAVSSFNVALTSFLLSLGFQHYEVGRQMMFWLLGGLDGKTWEHAAILLPCVALGGIALWLYARDLDILALGDLHAVSVGVQTGRSRAVLIMFATLITSAAVAVSGAIGFVGLIIPHIARVLVGTRHRALLPVTAIYGGAFLMLADLIARVAIAPQELRLGVVTALIGAPYFIALLTRRRVESSL